MLGIGKCAPILGKFNLIHNVSGLDSNRLKIFEFCRSEQEKNFQNIVPYDSEPVRKARRRMLKKQSTQLEEEEEEESLEESPTQQPNRLQEQPSKKQPKDLRKQSLSGQRSKIINLDRVCDICQRKFASDRLLKCHKELAHKPVQCDKCRRYLPAEKFAAHMEMHRINKKKKLYKCNYCDYMSEKKCVDFVLHMIHKYDKKESVETNGSAEDSAITPVE